MDAPDFWTAGLHGLCLCVSARCRFLFHTPSHEFGHGHYRRWRRNPYYNAPCIRVPSAEDKRYHYVYSHIDDRGPLLPVSFFKTRETG